MWAFPLYICHLQWEIIYRLPELLQFTLSDRTQWVGLLLCILTCPPRWETVGGKGPRHTQRWRVHQWASYNFGPFIAWRISSWRLDYRLPSEVIRSLGPPYTLDSTAPLSHDLLNFPHTGLISSYCAKPLPPCTPWIQTSEGGREWEVQMLVQNRKTRNILLYKIRNHTCNSNEDESKCASDLLKENHWSWLFQCENLLHFSFLSDCKFDIFGLHSF